MARELLREHTSPHELDEICGLITLHDKRNPLDNAYSPYLKLLQDADMLDHFGSMNVWISFLWAAYKEESPAFMLHRFEQNGQTHREENRALLNYPQSVVIYDEKVAFEQDFYARFRLESEGGIIASTI